MAETVTRKLQTRRPERGRRVRPRKPREVGFDCSHRPGLGKRRPSGRTLGIIDRRRSRKARGRWTEGRGGQGNQRGEFMSASQRVTRVARAWSGTGQSAETRPQTWDHGRGGLRSHPFTSLFQRDSSQEMEMRDTGDPGAPYIPLSPLPSLPCPFLHLENPS